jgi:hemin uptake protein HemP
MMSRDEAEQSVPGQIPTVTRMRRLKVSEVLAGERQVILEHDGQDYRLRITANGKLILTK